MDTLMRYGLRGALLVGLLFCGTSAQGADMPSQAELLERYGLSPGLQITQANADLVKDLVPEAIYQRVQKGDYVFTIGHFDPPDRMPKMWDKQFTDANEQNIGKYELSDGFGIIDKTTGERPWPMPLGVPYPDLDFSEDPVRLGAKIAWNTVGASNATCNEVDDDYPRLVSSPRNGTYDRYFDPKVIRQYVEFRRDPLAVSRPVNFQEIFFFLGPSDAFGAATLTWRWADPEKWDSVWNYSPAIRRLRRSTAANRSDTVLGTEFAIDDAEPGYAGKIEMMDWRYVGQTVTLMPVSRRLDQAADDYTATNTYQSVPSSHFTYKDLEGSYMPIYKDLKFGLHQSPQQHASWFIYNVLWVPVNAYVVEAFPKDPYYNYGRQIYFFEVNTYAPLWKQIYNRNGEFWRTTVLLIEFPRYQRNGMENVCADARAIIIADEKTNRGTVGIADGSLVRGGSKRDDTHYPSPGAFPTSNFDLSKFLQYGK